MPIEPLEDPRSRDGEKTDAPTITLPNENHFILLCVATLGLYAIWWMYRSWRFFDEREPRDLLPFLRALISIIFLPGLLLRIQNYARITGYPVSFSPILIYLGFVGLNLTGYLPKPYFLITLTAYLMLLPPYRAFYSGIDLDPGYRLTLQETLNQRQIFLLAAGIGFWFLLIDGMV
mgnify:CR=1 FL=1